MNKQDEIIAQRVLLNKLIKQVVARIKEVQQEAKDCLSEVTLTECNGLPPRRSKKQNVKSYQIHQLDSI